MNPLDLRRCVYKKRSSSPTFDGFKAQLTKKRNVSHSSNRPSSDQGWNRCMSGFDEDVINDELKSHRGTRNRISAKTAKFAQQAVSETYIEGQRSEEEEAVEDDPGDVDINWSDSNDSNVSDGEPLVCDESSPDSKREKAKRKHHLGKLTSSVSVTKKGKSLIKARHWLSKDQAVEVEIQDTGDEDESIGGHNRQASTYGSKVTQQVSQASTSKTDATIDDYESPNEEHRIASISSSPSIASQLSQQTTGSGQICELSPSPTEEMVAKAAIAGTSTKITGSQWIKKLILPVDSPDKAAGEGMVPAHTPSAAGDSAKKKSKFVKSGLTDRLQKLMNREKSSIAFWNHQIADGKKQTQGSSSTLTIRIISMECVQGLHITRCTILTPRQSLDEQTDDDTKQVFVLFALSTVEHHKLTVGSCVRIYPPWQKLTLPNYNEPVILCTYLCQSISSTDDATGSPVDMATTSAASTNSLKKPFQPLRLFEGLSKPSTHTTSTGSLLESITPAEAKTPVSDSILDCIAESGAYSTSGMCIRARLQRVYCKRINSPPSMGFRPIGRQQTPGHTTQWTMLFQDRHGVLCELQLPIDVLNRPKWKEHIQHGEGKIYIVGGVKVVHRNNRARSPGLFSLIDSLSSPSDSATNPQFSSQSQSDTEDVDTHGSKLTRGSFQNVCYTLGFQLGQGTMEEDTAPAKHQISYRPSQVCSIKDILQKTDTSQSRLSCYATVLHTSPYTSPELLSANTTHTTNSSLNTGWHVLVSDASLQTSLQDGMCDGKDEEDVYSLVDAEREDGCARDSGSDTEYVYIHIRNSCVLCGLDMAVDGQFGSQVYLKDICMQQLDTGCSLYADMYSAILKLDNNCQRCDRINSCHQPEDGTIIPHLSRVTMPTLPTLTDSSTMYSLVMVDGKINGVDETTAYSWPVCGMCGNDKLQGDASISELRCSSCDVPITNPVIKMHLEVFLECDASYNNNTLVKVKLLQSTIESILPPVGEEDEGYDIQCIMGKTLEPIRCFLSNISVLPSEEICIELEEISTPQFTPRPSWLCHRS